MEWQYNLLKEIFKKHGVLAKSISSLPKEDFLTFKTPYLPESLFKFYAPTIENLSDVSNERLWLASPISFNDPKDCQMTINEEIDVYIFRKYLEESEEFSQEEKDRIYRSLKRKDASIYIPDIYEILTHKKLYDKISHHIYELKQRIFEYINNLKSTNYRIACFSQKNLDYLNYQTLMWAHYAQSYRGFCVEYDVEKIFSSNINYYSSYNYTSTGIFSGKLNWDEINKIFINGFFPVVYKSKQISIPSATAYYIAKEKCCNKYLNHTQILFLKSLITKELIWKYEQEWRLIVDEELIKNIGYKIPFPFAKRIYVGEAASMELKLLLKQISEKLDIEYCGYSAEVSYNVLKVDK